MVNLLAWSSSVQTYPLPQNVGLNGMISQFFMWKCNFTVLEKYNLPWKKIRNCRDGWNSSSRKCMHSVVLVFAFYFVDEGMRWTLSFHSIYLHVTIVFVVRAEVASRQFRIAEMLYYKVLETVTEQEQKRLGDMDLSVSKQPPCWSAGQHSETGFAVGPSHQDPPRQNRPLVKKRNHTWSEGVRLAPEETRAPRSFTACPQPSVSGQVPWLSGPVGRRTLLQDSNVQSFK